VKHYFFNKPGALLLVFALCCLFFVMGRRSAESEKPHTHYMHQSNELDRLMQETAGR
jgi:hypothetical protein